MPRRELKDPKQVEAWLAELGGQLTQPGRLVLIGSGALLWHAAQRGITEPLPENSMVSIRSQTPMKSPSVATTR